MQFLAKNIKLTPSNFFLITFLQLNELIKHTTLNLIDHHLYHIFEKNVFRGFNIRFENFQKKLSTKCFRNFGHLFKMLMVEFLLRSTHAKHGYIKAGYFVFYGIIFCIFAKPKNIKTLLIWCMRGNILILNSIRTSK